MSLLSVSSRYALRSLRRNARRTALSVFGVAFGVGIGLFALAFVRGEETLSLDSAAGGGIGHLRFTPEGWNESRDADLRLPDWESLLQRVRAADGVEVATPRASVGGLLGLGTRSSHVMLTGVEPESEFRALRYLRGIEEGRYLEAGEEGAIVVGRAIADRLGAELDDELVVTSVDDEGEMQSRLLVVVGIVSTGSRPIDQTIAHVVLSEVEVLSGRAGAAEITLLGDDPNGIEALQEALSPLTPEGAELLSWLDVSPELRNNLEGDDAFMDMAIFIILLVVLMGVASAQLTGVLERRKEFAVLAAVGMRGLSLVRVVLVEGIALGVGSAALALLWISPLLYKASTDGIDLGAAYDMEGGWALGGILMEPIIHPEFGLWVVPTALFLSLTATVVASLYPAWFAARTNPASALRVDR
ncbi:MAG: ABC transporter permease [Sandaracinaceae bacterium]